MTEISSELEFRLNAILNREPDAVRFFKAFNAYCHEIDDAIDEYWFKDKPLPPEVLIKLQVTSAALFTSNFYHRYGKDLYPVILVIANTYADSVKWEHDKEAWKRHYANVMRHAGNDMLLVIVGVIGGWDAMREVSVMLRELSHDQHTSIAGEPV